MHGFEAEVVDEPVRQPAADLVGARHYRRLLALVERMHAFDPHVGALVERERRLARQRSGGEAARAPLHVGGVVDLLAERSAERALARLDARRVAVDGVVVEVLALVMQPYRRRVVEAQRAAEAERAQRRGE